MAVIEFWEPNRSKSSEKFSIKYVRTTFTLTIGSMSFKWELPAFLGVQLSLISSLHEPQKKRCMGANASVEVLAYASSYQ